MDTSTLKRIALLYLRLSDGRFEEGDLEKRETRLRDYAEHRGYEVGRVVVENDEMPGKGKQKNASAFKRSKIKLPDGRIKLRVNRPGFRSILDDLAGGRADVIVVEDLDRLMRDPRDLEDLIDICGYYKRSADSLSGSLRFTDGGNDGEITNARFLVAIANKSSRDTARRVAAARERRAPAGKWGGGQRPYGFLQDGVTPHPEEAAEIVEWGKNVLAGVGLRAICADLRKRGVLTVRGNEWTIPSLRETLIRHRNAGILVYRPTAANHGSDGRRKNRYTPDEIVGRIEGETIMSEDVWRAVTDKLLNPDRNHSPGSAPKWLGSGLYLCICGRTMNCKKGAGRKRAYVCSSTGMGLGSMGAKHTSRKLEEVDALVIETILEMLSAPDAATLFLDPVATGVDLNSLRADIAAAREREKVFATEFAGGAMKREVMLAGLARIEADIAKWEAVLGKHTKVSPLASLIGAEDIRAAWEAFSLGMQQEAVRALVTVTILPGSGPRVFDPSTVRITRTTRATRGAEDQR